MTDAPPPEWAMKKAREAIAKQENNESLSQVVARALAAEREEATMAEQERVEININALKAVFYGKGPFALGAQKALDQLAAAIRAGE